MLSAKEDFSFFHKNFEIYTSRDFSNSSIIARLHSYFRNTEFILYDKGISPYKNKNIVGENKQKLRRYLMQIKYLNDKKFMHFLVYLPKDNIFLNKNFNIDKNHKDKLNNKTLNETMIFENSMPNFDFYLKTFVDNFSDRVKEKSKFNFKIINEGKKNN